MPVDCQRSTSGGKGNIGMFIERDPRVCAAGLPTAQPDDQVADSLKHYLLKDEVDAILSDAIIPSLEPRKPLPLRRPIPLDKRFGGPFCDMASIINPPIKTKFQTLVDDFKDTTYSSYWKKILGSVPDIVPMIPEGYDVHKTFGKKTPFHGRLYDVVMPKVPLPDKTPHCKKAGVQCRRNYCTPPYEEDVTYGHRTGVDKRGTYAKCCLTDDQIILGTGDRCIISSIKANFKDTTSSRLGTVLAPNNNIKEVPEGYAFGILKPPGNLPQCLATCEMNPNKVFLKKCLGHLNSLRKYLSKRFLPTFFHKLYLELKHFDKEKSGWLPRLEVYNFCATKLVRFDSNLIEPLLQLWQAFDGSQIEYKTFVHVINYREPSLEIPKIPDLPNECIDYRTTYTEMVKPDQITDTKRMAGLPSGRYFDLDYPVTPERCTKADRACLPHESDMKSCLNPSVLTLTHVTHRDMYAKRDPEVVRRVFDAAGEKLSNERFEKVWDDAKKYHSQGWVCYETFRRALENNPP